MEIKTTKWDIEATIYAGTHAEELAKKYEVYLQQRLKRDELLGLKTNIKELMERRSGQKEVLVDQKAKTGTQDKMIKDLHNSVMEIRAMVKAVTTDKGIRKAFGVGENTRANSVNQVKAEANIIFEAYKTYTDWANSEAGIINADIEELTDLLNTLTEADDKQEQSKINRKLATMDKDVLQRTVEDTVTKISVIGVHVFARKEPAVAALFADLIPNSK